MLKKFFAPLLLVLTATSGFLYWQFNQPTRAHAANGTPPSETVAAPVHPQRQPAMDGQKTSPSVGNSALWTSTMSVSGQPIDVEAAKAAHLQGRIATGLIATLDAKSVTLAQLQQGQAVTIPLPNGTEVHGVVNLVQTDKTGAVQIGGSLADNAGSFSLTQGNGTTGGRILLPKQKLAYLVSTPTPGQIQIRQLTLSDVMCDRLDRDTSPAATPASERPQAAQPVLRSRPDASIVLYLDFDGATVTDPDWPAYASDGETITGPTIVAAPSPLSNAEITAVWNRVKEDFAPFQINVTTVENDYTTAAIGKRMRVIVTPTDAAAPGAGGVAYKDSLARAGAAGGHGYSDDIPAWVFNPAANDIAEAISHEAGHTLGLSHDGRTSPAQEYYPGHGVTQENWAPIMGTGYYRNIVQWSKGEYPNADNHEDDVAIISGNQPTPLTGATNASVYWPDEAGNTRGSANAWDPQSTDVSGLITAATDVDFYTFTLAAARYITINGTSANDLYRQPNLNLRLEIQDGSGNVLAVGDPDNTPDASASATLPAGTYFLKVGGTGRPAFDPFDAGYSNYGSIGSYTLHSYSYSAVPVVTSATTASVGVAQPFSYQILYDGAGGGQITGFAATNLPSGLTLDTSTGLITGKPTIVGVFSIALSVSNAVATGSATLTLTVNDAPPGVLNQTGRQALTPGASATLTVDGFSANSAISYQWIHDGAPVNGATTNTLALNNVSRGANGAYWVEMTNAIGTSRSAPIFVRVAPAITQVLGWVPDGFEQFPAPVGLTNAVQAVPSVSVGASTVIAVRADGTVSGWGSTSSSSYYAPPGDLTRMVDARVNFWGGFGLRDDGTAARWAGYVGNYPSLRDVFALAVGHDHVLAVKTDGTVSSVSLASPQNAATVPAGLSNVTAISAGNGISMALKTDGTVVTWGSGATPPPAGLNNVVAINCGQYHFLALKSDGTVVAWGGQNFYGEINVPVSLANVVAIAGGGNQSFALKSDGTVVAWGSNEIAVPAGLNKVFALSASTRSLYIVRDSSSDTAPVVTGHPANQTVAPGAAATFTVTPSGDGPFSYRWRYNNTDLTDSATISGTTTATLTIKDVLAEDAGAYSVVVTNHVGNATSNPATLTVTGPKVTNRPLSKRLLSGQSLVLDASATGVGTLHYLWKHDGAVIPGATGPTLPINSATVADRGRYEVIISDDNSSALTVFYVHVAVESAALVAWGRNDYGQTNVSAISGTMTEVRAGQISGLVVKGDGTVTAWGTNAPAVPAGLANVVDVAVGGAGQYFALKEDGTVVGWGSGESGQLEIPSGLTNVVALSSNAYHTIALKANGTIVTWGRVSSFQTPTPTALTKIVAVAAAAEYFMALKTDGTVVEWGEQQAGGVYKPNNLNDVIGIAAGNRFSLALRQGGEVVAWRDVPAQLPAELPNVIELDAGSSHVLALRGEGVVTAWGFSSGYNETTVPNNLTGVISVQAGQNFSVALTSAKAGAPAIATAPIGLSLSEDDAATFTVAATGAGLSYEWRKDGATLANGGRVSGATSASLTISNLTLADAGRYTVIVRNSSGSAVSSTRLKVTDAPVITSRPLSRSVAVGQPVTLTCTVSGSGLTYQWKRNGQIIAGATTSTLTIPQAAMTDRGRYEMIVTSASGASTRSVLMLYVWSPNSWLVGWGGGSDVYGLTTVPADLGAVVNFASGGSGNFVVRPDGTVTGWGHNHEGSQNIPNNLTNVIAVAAGSSVAALRADGTVVAWGSNQTHQTEVPAGLNNVAAIIAASDAFFALRTDGTVVAWGSTINPTPNGETDVVAMATSSYVSMVLKADGSLKGWTAGSGTPPTITGARLISLGSGFGLYVDQNGFVQHWGAGSYGLSMLPAGLANPRVVASGDRHHVVVKADGTVAAWGNNTAHETDVPVGLSGVFDLAVNYNINLALVSNDLPPLILSQPQDLSVVAGSVATFRARAAGGPLVSYRWQRQAAGSATWSDLSPNATYSTVNTAELVITGTTGAMQGDKFRCLATNASGTSTSTAANLTVTATGATSSVAASNSTTIFVTGDGSLWGMGSNYAGQLGVPFLLGNTTGPLSAVPITTGVAKVLPTKGAHNLFLKADGTLWGMGNNNEGQLGDGTTTSRSTPIQIATQVADACGGMNFTLILKTDGTVWLTGASEGGIRDLVPRSIASGIAAVSAGHFHMLFLKTDGTLWAMGSNNEGQLGDGTQTSRSSRVQIATGVAKIASGNYHSVFIKTDGTLWGMGANSGGELGDGTTTRRLSPIQIASGVVAASAGSHTLFLKTNGALWGTGPNGYGQLGDGTDYTNRTIPALILNDVASFSAGATHSAIIKTDGTLLTMGANDYGQLGTGDGNRRVTPFVVPSPSSHPPTVSFSLSSQRKLGETITIDFDVGDPDGNYRFANLWVETPRRGWLAIIAGNAVVPSHDLTLMNSVAHSAGHYTRTFLLSDGPGVYRFSMAAVDAVGLSTVTTTQSITVVGPNQTHQDFNGDGYADLVLQNLTTGARSIRLMNGTTVLSETSLSDLPKAWSIVTTIDFNGDKQADLLLQNLTTGERKIRLMNGTTAGADVDLGIVPPDWFIGAAADFNADGKPDILWSHVSGARYLWLMDGVSILGFIDLGHVPPDWFITAAADFNGDGKPDILWQHASGARYLWFMNGVALVGFADLGSMPAEWANASVADFNRDGNPDILFQNTFTGQCHIWFMNGSTKIGTADLGSLPAGWSLAGVPERRPPTSAHDFNGDGYADILGQNAAGQRCVWFMNGATTLGSASLPTIAPEWSSAATADFNADGQVDILLQNLITGERKIQLMNGTTPAGEVSMGTVPPDWFISAVADFNGDGKPDIFWTHTSGARYLWLMDGVAILGFIDLGNVPPDWSVSAAADFNGDGKPDILWSHDSGARYLWFMNGTSLVSFADLGTLLPEWSIGMAADFNGDDKPDILWQHSSGARYLWFMNGSSVIGTAYLGTVPPGWHIVN